MTYEFQWKIETLAENAAVDENGMRSFCRLGIEFSPWDNQWLSQHCWLATGQIEASNYDKALHQFRGKLLRVIPRVSLVGQCYIEFLNQPYIVIKKDFYLARFKYINEVSG